MLVTLSALGMKCSRYLDLLITNCCILYYFIITGMKQNFCNFLLMAMISFILLQDENRVNVKANI